MWVEGALDKIVWPNFKRKVLRAYIRESESSTFDNSHDVLRSYNRLFSISIYNSKSSTDNGGDVISNKLLGGKPTN